MPTWKGIKSSTTPGNIIGNGKFAEMPESEFEETPFGKKAIRVVVSGSKITSGAKRLGASYKSSIIPEETYLGHKISNRNYTGALG